MGACERRCADAETIAVALEPGVTPTELARHVHGTTRLAVRAITRLFGHVDADAGARVCCARSSIHWSAAVITMRPTGGRHCVRADTRSG